MGLVCSLKNCMYFRQNTFIQVHGNAHTLKDQVCRIFPHARYSLGKGKEDKYKKGAGKNGGKRG